MQKKPIVNLARESVTFLRENLELGNIRSDTAIKVLKKNNIMFVEKIDDCIQCAAFNSMQVFTGAM